MKIKLKITLLSAALLYGNLGMAAVYYVDPIKGSSKNSGTAARPWRTLEEVVKKRLIETKTAKGVTKNKGAPVKSGDTIFLRTGFHGYVRIHEAYNDRYITVKAEKNHQPKLSYLEVASGKNWRFEKLIISSGFSRKSYKKSSMVILGDNSYWGKSRNLSLVNSYIYNVQDNSSWSKQDWVAKAKNGILVGRNTDNTKIENNFIENVKFGITVLSENSIIAGNVVNNFSADGIRINANKNVVKFNVVSNNMVVDENHDDGIQAFQLSTGKDLEDLNIVNNIILNRDNHTTSGLEGSMQGIGLFDGPYKDINIAENVVMSFSWHGIGLFDAQSSVIANNLVFTPSQVDNFKARVTLSSKVTDNLDTLKGIDIYGNYASQYNLPEKFNNANSIVKKDQNFVAGLNKLASTIDKEYGEIHSLAKKARFNKQLLNAGLGAIFASNKIQKLKSYVEAEKMYSKNMVFDAGYLKDSFGPNVRYYWDFGDGSFSEGQVVRHSYPSTCSYPVSVVIKDQYGREIEKSDESWITVDLKGNASKNTSVFVNE